MKLAIPLVFLVLCIGCTHRQQRSSTATAADSFSAEVTTEATDDTPIPDIEYSEKELLAFFDSVGALPTQTLIDQLWHGPDSIYYGRTTLNMTIAPADFELLKQAAKQQEITIDLAERIFGKQKLDDDLRATGKMSLTLMPFSTDSFAFKQYAIALGPTWASWNAVTYFCEGNKIIAMHDIYHRYGLEIEHFTDSDGKTVIYYKENYQSGSGIWWFNFQFYKYYDGRLIPVLSELENGNLQHFWGPRVYWLEAFVQSTRPLTLKMVYYQEFFDQQEDLPRVVDDSTIIRYNWDETSKTLVGDYAKSKLTKAQILTYNVEDTHLLYINAYHERLKACLADRKFRKATLAFLNTVKNHEERKKAGE